MHGFVLHNGEIRNAQDASISPGQVGFLNGWGVFSTLRVQAGVLFAFERHYARMRHDAHLMHVPFSFSAADLEGLLQRLIEANQAQNATLRVAIVRNRGGVFEAPVSNREADVVAFTADLANWGDGVHLTYVPNGRFGASPFAGTKVTSWAQNLTWYEEAHQRGFDESVLLNEQGQVSECTSANIFAIRRHEVWTPPLTTSGCLPGVTRAILLEEIGRSNLTTEIKEKELTPSEMEKCDQVFITSTTRDLLPVLSVDREPLRQERQIFDQLQAAFLRYRLTYRSAAAAQRELVSR